MMPAMKSRRPYPLIAVAGTMGSGKTTAARLLSDALQGELVEENFGQNAFLSRFYEDMPRWAFHSQTFFLMEKISQLRDIGVSVKRKRIIQDTPLEQDVFSYAKAQYKLDHLDASEWRLYKKIYEEFSSHMPRPDILVWLETSVPILIERIKGRGREYEQHIPDSYIALLDELNHEWLNDYKGRIIRIPTDGLNIVKSSVARETFCQMVADAMR